MAAKSARTAWASAEVVRIVGVKLSTLHYWHRSGLMRASVYDPEDRRQGVGRVWSYADLVALRTIVRLREAGVSLQGVRKAVDRLRREIGGDDARVLAKKRLVTDGSDVFEVVKDDTIVSVLKRPGQHLWRVIALDDVLRDVEKAVERAAKASTRKVA